MLRRVTINAPVSGTIVRMHYHTSGGVIEGGKAILEILPSDVPLIIEAMIPRTEIDNVKVGQKATVTARRAQSAHHACSGGRGLLRLG